MEGINPRWYAQMMWYQRKSNVILSSATMILAITSILQLIKIYGVEVPTFLFLFFAAAIELAFLVVVIEIFSRPKF